MVSRSMRYLPFESEDMDRERIEHKTRGFLMVSSRERTSKRVIKRFSQ